MVLHTSARKMDWMEFIFGAKNKDGMVKVALPSKMLQERRELHPFYRLAGTLQSMSRPPGYCPQPYSFFCFCRHSYFEEIWVAVGSILTQLR